MKYTINREQYNALCHVVDYLHDEELKHYEEEEGYNKNHIWHSVLELSLFCKEIQIKE